MKEVVLVLSRYVLRLIAPPFLRLFASIFRFWIPTWAIVILFFINLAGIVVWSAVAFSLLNLNELINVSTYLIVPIFIISTFLSILLIIFRSDMGLIYFSPIWKPHGDIFIKKKFKEAKEVWYMTTVGRYLLGETEEQQLIPQKDRFHCLLLDPWSKYFDERMQIERPQFQSGDEARNAQLHYCKHFLRLKNDNIRIRWYDLTPRWRIIIFDKRYVAVGWFPDYSEKPKGNENKGYSGPLLILDREAIRRNVAFGGAIFPMSNLADAFLKYFESIWQL